MTTSSDFPGAIARISEGFCPLCDVRLADHEVNQVSAREHETARSITAELGDVTGFVVCFRCRVGWRIEAYGERRALSTSRALHKEEIKRLYDRSGGTST